MSNSGKWLHIRVTDLQSGKSKVNVKVPASLANFGLKMAARFAPDEIEGLDMDQIISAIKDSGDTKFVDVEDVENGEHVEVYIE